jgi:hypothetical protein
MATDDELISQIADSIERYLMQRPEAADTAEGISTWWLSTPLGADAVPAVLAALRQLEARGIVVRTERGGGPTIFSGASRRGGAVH